MKKDIKWLRKDFDRIFNHNIRINSDKEWDKGWNFGWYEARATVYALTIQLDEAEVLSQEWINEHAKAVTYDGMPDQTEVVYVDDLQNLLVPTLSETETVADVIADFFKSLERLKEVMSMEVEEWEE